MKTRISIFRSFALFISIFFFLFVLAGKAQAQGTDTTTELTGEASVVIYDDFVKGKSETRFYLIDRGKGRETRLFFKNGAPKVFRTGKKVKVRVTKKAPERTPLQDVRHAGDLLTQAVELVVKAGAKEAQQLVSTASEVVKKIRSSE